MVSSFLIAGLHVVPRNSCVAMDFLELVLAGDDDESGEVEAQEAAPRYVQGMCFAISNTLIWLNFVLFREAEQ